MWGADDVIFVGDDWAEDHHDVFVCDVEGVPISQRRFPEGRGGDRRCLHELVAGVVDDPVEVVVGIETDRGLWVQALIEAGYTVYAINPMSSVAVSGSAHAVGREVRCGGREDARGVGAHRSAQSPPGGGGLAELREGVKVLARAHQSLIWERVRTTSRLR